MSMTRHQHDQTLASLSSSIQKVYEAIPSADWWTAPQIAAELFRQGIRQDTNRISGGIKTLVDAGLARERGKKFQRTYCFPLEEVPKQPKQFVPPPIAPSPPKPEPKDMAAAPSKLVASQTAAKAGDPLAKLIQHADYLRRLADEIDEAALEAQQLIEEAKKNGRRFEQLQKLLNETTE